jgi:pilus assembly protein CpaC
MGADLLKRILLCAAAGGALLAAQPALAQVSVATGVGAGELDVPVNKSQVLRSDQPYTKALIGNPDIADIVPITDTSVYVLGKKTGTTSLTLYNHDHLIAVVDIVVGPDVVTLKRQLSELLPAEQVSARMSNDSIVLEGIVQNAVDADRAVQIAETYAPGKVVNLLALGSSQQVMLEVRFAEVKRSALSQIGLSWGVNGSRTDGVIGNGASQTNGRTVTTTVTNPDGSTSVITDQGDPIKRLGSIVDSFAIVSRTFRAFGADFNVTLDALETKGAVTTLAEPTLVALSGETASFLAGGEFPIPVAGSQNAITVEYKKYGVSLEFTPTVLDDGLISLDIKPEVSSVDTSSSYQIGNLAIPGFVVRRAQTSVDLKNGQSFMIAGLLQNQYDTSTQRLPGLGKLPILGTLFSSKAYQRRETDLVIIITPYLVKPVDPTKRLQTPFDGAAAATTADYFLGDRDEVKLTQASAGPRGPVAPARGYGHYLELP